MDDCLTKTVSLSRIYTRKCLTMPHQPDPIHLQNPIRTDDEEAVWPTSNCSTGKTRQMLKTAVDQARTGKAVAVVARDEEAVSRLGRRMSEILLEAEITHRREGLSFEIGQGAVKLLKPADLAG